MRGTMSFVSEQLKAFKEEGEIDESDDRGFTPIAWAARNGHAEVVEYLISTECNLESGCFGGSRPCITLSTKTSEKVVKMLLAAGCDANATDDNMDTPLHIARQGEC